MSSSFRFTFGAYRLTHVFIDNCRTFFLRSYRSYHSLKASHARRRSCSYQPVLLREVKHLQYSMYSQQTIGSRDKRPISLNTLYAQQISIPLIIQQRGVVQQSAYLRHCLGPFRKTLSRDGRESSIRNALSRFTCTLYRSKNSD